MKTPPHNTTTLNSDHRRKASPQVQGGRIAECVTPGVRLSARNLGLNHATGTLYIVRPDDALRRDMAKRKKAANEAAAECVLRVVTRDGRTLIEIEIPDEAARIQVAALILRGRD